MTEKPIILVADDDPDILEQICLALSPDGYQFLRAETQERAEELLLEARPDLAILDLMMDEMDSGFVLSHRIKQLYPGTPVILISAVTSTTGLRFAPQTADERAWVKADLVLNKPVVAERLRADVSRVLGESNRITGLPHTTTHA
jgi:two-component system, OmpR family, response regulator